MHWFLTAMASILQPKVKLLLRFKFLFPPNRSLFIEKRALEKDESSLTAIFLSLKLEMASKYFKIVHA